MATVEMRIALPSAKAAPHWNEPVPGWVTSSTPRNPTTSADQRWMPTTSLRMRIESRVVSSGAEKEMAVAPASGMSLKAKKMQVIEPSCDTARRK